MQDVSIKTSLVRRVRRAARHSAQASAPPAPPTGERQLFWFSHISGSFVYLKTPKSDGLTGAEVIITPEAPASYHARYAPGLLELVPADQGRALSEAILQWPLITGVFMVAFVHADGCLSVELTSRPQADGLLTRM